MKPITSPRSLAIFGAPPTFDEPLHVGRPNLGNRAAFMRRVDEILDSRWFSNNGPMVREFEQAVAKHAAVKHCIAMCNGTAALQNAIAALELAGEVIVPSFTFVATAHALQSQKITPVFCGHRSGELHARPSERRADDHAAHERDSRRPRLGQHLRCREPGSDLPAPWPHAPVRRRARIRLFPPRHDDRQLRLVRSVELPCDEVLQHLRRRRRPHQRRHARREASADEEFRVRRCGQRGPPRRRTRR